MKSRHLPAMVRGMAFILLDALLLLPLVSAQTHPMSGMPTPPPSESPQDTATSPSGLTLAELEQLALSNNPTLVQAAGEIRAAAARKLQSGLYPNPTAGY